MRLFLAVLLDDAIVEVLCQFQKSLSQSCDGVRWVRSDQLHLTLKFLGDVPDREVKAVGRAMARSAAKHRPFEMTIGGCGCFPQRGPVRIVWAGIQETSGVLGQCVDALEQELETLGFPRERRPFSAHITVGRVRDDSSGGQLRSALDAGVLAPREQSVSSIVLMSSVLSPKGPTYTPVSTVQLGTANQP